MNSKLLVFLSAFTLLGCNDDSVTEPNQTVINQEIANLIEISQGIWTSSNIQTYTFTYYSPPTDCPNADPIPPIEITVEDGVITRAFIPELDEILDLEDLRYPTINGIFIHMNEDLLNITETPVFDTTFGYPIKYNIDKSDAECDGYSVNVSSFI